MKKSSEHIRHGILRKLYSHLEEHYALSISESTFREGSLTIHQLDALLAFKSDPLLDELRSALNRLEEGTFGVCLSCKDRIDEDLMDADPTRRMCKRCESVYSHAARRRESLTLHV
jgi:RNA polymerase-binding transcription factor DksA